MIKSRNLFVQKQAYPATKLLKKSNCRCFPLRNMENKGLAADSNFF